MRRLEHLIYDTRFESGNPDTTRFSDLKFNKLYSDAQRALQALIVSVDEKGKHFTKSAIQDTVADQEEYSLPSDIYATNSIISVGLLAETRSTAASIYYPLDPVTERENRLSPGYGVRDNELFLSPPVTYAKTNGLKITYTKKLPSLSVRLGKVSVVTSGVSIQLAATYSSEVILNHDDFVTVVDVDGTIIRSGIRVTAYATGLLSTADALTGVTSAHYVVLGKLATSHSELSDACETIMNSMVKKALFAIDASKEFNMAELITAEEKGIITGLFKKNDQDVVTPPVSGNSYLNY